MNKKVFYPAAFTVIFMMILSACIPGFINANQQSDGSQAATAAAQTLQAIETQVWIGTLQAELTRVSGEQSGGNNATNTSEPGSSQQDATPTQTVAPATNTPQPPTATAQPPTAKPTPCYWAQFVKDVTIPDGTEIDAGDPFTKTWRLKNIGACSWNTGFDLVFVSGNAMDSDAAVDFPENVQPGETVDVSVDFIAPEDEGEYKSNWKLRSDTGVVFGLGVDQNSPFFALIEVPEDVVVLDPDEPLNFAASYKAADWTSSEGEPSNEDDYTNGTVYSTKKPQMEKNRVDDELALMMIPGSGEDGYISGRYPAMNVEDGDILTALAGCSSEKPKCNVTFEIRARTEDNTLLTLGSWDEVYDGEWTQINLDLSDLAGEKVRFILRVENNGSSKDDKVFWLSPRIIR